jgi:hypothetical protein
MGCFNMANDHFHDNSNPSNGGESAVMIRALDGSTFLNQKLVPSSLCQNIGCKETQQLILGIGNTI